MTFKVPREALEDLGSCLHPLSTEAIGMVTAPFNKLRLFITLSFQVKRLTAIFPYEKPRGPTEITSICSAGEVKTSPVIRVVPRRQHFLLCLIYGLDSSFALSQMSVKAPEELRRRGGINIPLAGNYVRNSGRKKGMDQVICIEEPVVASYRSGASREYAQLDMSQGLRRKVLGRKEGFGAKPQ